VRADQLGRAQLLAGQLPSATEEFANFSRVVMASTAAIADRETVLASFRGWQAEQQSLDAQLAESLAALAAFQSHLDSWQQQLSAERDELRTSREDLERNRKSLEVDRTALEHDRAAAEKLQAAPSPEILAELNAARDKIAKLTTSLLERTEELRTLDGRRAEFTTELELARAREKELSHSLDEQKRTFEQERAKWSQELHHLHELLERRVETIPVPAPASIEQPQPTKSAGERPPAPAPETKHKTQVTVTPVLGSIVEQFGKLRQQRANDRQAVRKTR
jgi:chromosome segregation ATPase